MTPEITTGLFTICGVLIGGLIGYFSARYVAKINARLKAVANFRASFAPEISQMRMFSQGKKPIHPTESTIKDGNYIHFLLDTALPRHAKAIEEFSPYISNGCKKNYYKAWEEYYAMGFLDYYMGDKPYELFFERTHAILQFTE